MITAAHCVRDAATGAYSHNVVFALEYANGKYRRLYKATCMRTYSGWVSPDASRYLYDYAFVKVDARSATGHWGASWDWIGRYDSATKTGYPRGILDGEVIQVDGGPISVTNGIVEMRHGNSANQHGSSGGAWIGKYSDTVGQNNYIISVESFGYPDKPGVDYGPYLDADARYAARQGRRALQLSEHRGWAAPAVRRSWYPRTGAAGERSTPSGFTAALPATN